MGIRESVVSQTIQITYGTNLPKFQCVGNMNGTPIRSDETMLKLLACFAVIEFLICAVVFRVVVQRVHHCRSLRFGFPLSICPIISVIDEFSLGDESVFVRVRVDGQSALLDLILVDLPIFIFIVFAYKRLRGFLVLCTFMQATDEFIPGDKPVVVRVGPNCHHPP
jgi:hypothetical protein